MALQVGYQEKLQSFNRPYQGSPSSLPKQHQDEKIKQFKKLDKLNEYL